MSEPFVSECCEGERCCFEGCSAPAEHKVEETIFHDDPLQIRHELTAYICHEHFRQIMGAAADRVDGRRGRRALMVDYDGQEIGDLREALEEISADIKPELCSSELELIVWWGRQVDRLQAIARNALSRAGQQRSGS